MNQTSAEPGGEYFVKRHGFEKRRPWRFNLFDQKSMRFLRATRQFSIAA
jgi:hypothetical protein